MSNHKFTFPLLISFVFLLSCGSEPKASFQNSKSTDTTEITLTEQRDTSEAPLIDTVAIAVDSTIEQLALAKEEKDAEEIAKQEQAQSAKLEKAREERRKKRRAKRKAKEAADRKGKPTIKFEKMVHRYGTIEQGEKIKHNFVFKNTGNKELVISNAKATCGCTQPSFPFVPIAPGEEGYIGVVFDSKGRLGHQRPKVTITTNADPPTYEIFLEGNVDSEKKEGK
ncbi:MAG: DUF1573 domain-containing protein [Saprospiraceae bacterium]